MKKTTDLIFDDRNANAGTERGRAMVKRSLDVYGAGRSVLIDKHGKIIAGNKTVEAAHDLAMPIRVIETDGSELVVVQRTDLDLNSPKARELAVVDNRTSEVGLAWDVDALAQLIEDGADLSSMFDDAELSALLGSVLPEPGAGGDEFDPTPEDGPTRAQLGDLWSIGGIHRLLVGDCTDAANVARLMDGERAECMWSDPPYGVDYMGKDPRAMKIENDRSDDLPGLLCAAFSSADDALLPGAAIYIAHPAGALCVTFGNAFINQGWRFHQTLVWLKNSMVLGHSDYHFKHEPLIFGYKPGEGRYGRGGRGWYGDDSQVSVFEIDRPQASHDHPTEKPLGLIEVMLQNSSAGRGLVYDPFLGSGTTLIAAHRTGRRCYGMEISPRYADVILRRAEAEGLECIRDCR